MDCKACSGNGTVCDQCGDAMSLWRECDDCGGEFCSPPSFLPAHVSAQTFDCYAAHSCAEILGEAAAEVSR